MREITLTNTLQCAEPRYSINTHISISWFLPQSSLRVFFFFFIRCFFLYAPLCISHAVTHHNPTSMHRPHRNRKDVIFFLLLCLKSFAKLWRAHSFTLLIAFFINSPAQKKKNTEILPRGTLRVKFGPKLNAELFLPSEWKKKKKEAHLLRYPRSENRNIGYNHRWSCLGYLRRQ